MPRSVVKKFNFENFFCTWRNWIKKPLKRKYNNNNKKNEEKNANDDDNQKKRKKNAQEYSIRFIQQQKKIKKILP